MSPSPWPLFPSTFSWTRCSRRTRGSRPISSSPYPLQRFRLSNGERPQARQPDPFVVGHANRRERHDPRGCRVFFLTISRKASYHWARTRLPQTAIARNRTTWRNIDSPGTSTRRLYAFSDSLGLDELQTLTPARADPGLGVAPAVNLGSSASASTCSNRSICASLATFPA